MRQYAPGATVLNTYLPSPSLVVLTVRSVSGPTRVTVAPTTTACCPSRTVPEIPLLGCDHARPGSASQETITTNRVRAAISFPRNSDISSLAERRGGPAPRCSDSPDLLLVEELTRRDY